MANHVGVVGLGIMGSAYARHLIDAGFTTLGYDPDPAAHARFAAAGGHAASSPREVAQRCDVVLCALPSPAALEAACFADDGLGRGAAPGTVIVEASTFAIATKEAARERLASGGVAMLDAPVSGTGTQAMVRDLSVYASGDEAAFARARAALDAIAKHVVYVGPFGAGSKLKFIANLLVTIHILSTAEAVVLAEKSGVDPQQMLDIVGAGAGASRMMAIRGPMMAENRYEPPAMKLDIYQKDLAIIAEHAKAVGSPTPLFTLSTVFFTSAIAQGRGAQDTAAIAAVLKQMAGETP